MPDQPKHRLTPLVDLDYYCEPGLSQKYEFAKPFVRGGWKYAGDNVLCIRVPAGREATTKADDVPPFASLPWVLTTETNLSPWPAAEYVFAKAWVTASDSEEDEDDPDNDVLTWEPTKTHQWVGKFWVACENHYRVSILPNVRFLNSGDPKNGIYFRFDGGEGIIMPCRPPVPGEAEYEPREHLRDDVAQPHEPAAPSL
jgi:hypothetical protein